MNGARVVGVGPVHGPGQYEHNGPTTGIAAMLKKKILFYLPYNRPSPRFHPKLKKWAFGIRRLVILDT